MKKGDKVKVINSRYGEFIKGDWYYCNRNVHIYQFDKIDSNKFITSAWIHRGSFSRNYIKEEKAINLLYFYPVKKASTEITNKYLPKSLIQELW